MSGLKQQAALTKALLEGVPAFVSLKRDGATCAEIEAAFRSWDAAVDSQLMASVLNTLVHKPLKRKLGRKNSTRELADFAESNQNLTRKEIAARWNKSHPSDKKVDEEDVRGAWRRYHGDKAISTKIRAKH